MNEVIAKKIVAEASRVGVPPVVALAFALAESDIENVTGDLQLATSDAHHERVLREHPKNPHRDQRSLWVSYGPFQLQALWFVRDAEDPRVLSNVDVNVVRGVEAVRTKLRAYRSEELAREAYVCGAIGKCSPEKVARLREAYAEARVAAAAVLSRLQSDDLLGEAVNSVERPPREVMLAFVLLGFGAWAVARAFRRGT